MQKFLDFGGVLRFSRTFVPLLGVHLVLQFNIPNVQWNAFSSKPSTRRINSVKRGFRLEGK